MVVTTVDPQLHPAEQLTRTPTRLDHVPNHVPVSSSSSSFHLSAPPPLPPRVPVALQAVFLASNRGEEVLHDAPREAHQTFVNRNHKNQSKNKTTTTTTTTRSWGTFGLPVALYPLTKRSFFLRSSSSSSISKTSNTNGSDNSLRPKEWRRRKMMDSHSPHRTSSPQSSPHGTGDTRMGWDAAQPNKQTQQPQQHQHQHHLRIPRTRRGFTPRFLVSRATKRDQYIQMTTSSIADVAVTTDGTPPTLLSTTTSPIKANHHHQNNNENNHHRATDTDMASTKVKEEKDILMDCKSRKQSMFLPVLPPLTNRSTNTSTLEETMELSSEEDVEEEEEDGAIMETPLSNLCPNDKAGLGTPPQQQTEVVNKSLSMEPNVRSISTREVLPPSPCEETIIATTNPTIIHRQPAFPALSPQGYLDTCLEKRGYSTKRYQTLQTAFSNQPTNLQIASYSAYLVNLLREDRLQPFTEIISAGISPNPCNEFGESLLHLICRLNKCSFLQIVIENGCRLQVADDFGRTPLHDACWSVTPAFETVAMIVSSCDAGMFYLQDARGHLPLQYVRKDHWVAWIRWIQDHLDTYWPQRSYHDETTTVTSSWYSDPPNTHPLVDPPNAVSCSVARLLAGGRISPWDVRPFQAPNSSYDDDLVSDVTADAESDHGDWDYSVSSSEKTDRCNDDDDDSLALSRDSPIERGPLFDHDCFTNQDRGKNSSLTNYPDHFFPVNSSSVLESLEETDGSTIDDDDDDDSSRSSTLSSDDDDIAYLLAHLPIGQPMGF